MKKGTPYLLLLLILAACTSKKQVASGNGIEKPGGLSGTEDKVFLQKFHDANKYITIGDYEQAFFLFQDCIALKPDCDACHYQISPLYQFQGKTQDAIDAAKKAVAIDGENAWYLLQLAHMYRENLNYAESSKTFEKLTKQFPENPDYFFSLAESYLLQGKNEEAIDAFNSAENILGTSPELSMQKYQLFMQTGQKDKAILEVQKLIEQYPDEVQYYGILAEIYETQGEREKALEMYEKVLSIDPNNGIVHLSLYEYYKYEGNVDRSKQELRQALASDEVYIDDKMKVMLSFFVQSESDKELREECYDYLEILVKADSSEAKVQTVYGDFLYRDGRKEEAANRYRKAVNLSPDHANIWNQLVLIESEMQDYDNMLIDSEKALEVFPTQPSFYFFAGLANQQKKQFEQALQHFSTGKEFVVGNNPLLAEFYQQLGETYHTMKDFENADKNFDKSLELVPENPYLLNNYAYYLSLRKVKLEQAEDMSKKANALLPGSASFQDTYGWILFQQDNYSDALVWLEKALSSGGSEDATVLEHYGDLMFKQGKSSDALEYWKRAKVKGGASDLIDKKIEDQQYYE